MPADQASRELVKRLGDVLARAIVFFEIYRQSNAHEVLAQVTKQGTGKTFNLLREALHREICLQLVGLFDDDPRSITFLDLGRALTQDNVDDAAALDIANDYVRLLQEKPWFKELKKLRNKVIAHTDKEAVHVAKYGDEARLLDASIEAHAVFGRAVGTRFSAENYAALYARDAEVFWQQVGTK